MGVSSPSSLAPEPDTFPMEIGGSMGRVSDSVDFEWALTLHFSDGDLTVFPPSSELGMIFNEPDQEMRGLGKKFTGYVSHLSLDRFPVQGSPGICVCEQEWEHTHLYQPFS